MSYWQDKLVLVSGAGGFIGSHLVEALVRAGARVRAIVRYTSRGGWGNLDELDSEIRDTLEVWLGDIRDSEFVSSAVAGTECVFHLAALIGIPYSYTAPRSYVQTNVVGTLNVLEAVRAHHVPRMVNTSTSEAYGSAQYEPIDEEHPLQAQSPYSASKIGADTLVESYYKSFNLPVTTLRPFNNYGPRQSARAIIPTIITQLLARPESISLGSISPKRDLLFVEDTVNAFLAAAEPDIAIGHVINVGTGRSISIAELAQHLIQLINPGTVIALDESRVRPEKSEVQNLLCDSAKAGTLLNWQARVSLEDGLQRTIRYIEGNLHRFRPGYAI